jgi:hypothetical protein
MKVLKLGAVFAALLSVAACASQPEIPYDRSAAQNNKTIGLLTPGWSSGPSSVLASDVGRSFGLIGALVDASMQANRETELKQILTSKNVDVNSAFVARLKANLESKGFTIVAISADGKRTALLKKYPSTSDGVDSYLDVVVPNYGLLAAGIAKDAPYRPWFVSQVKLVRATDAGVLMQDTVTYNTIGEAKNVVTLSPDPKYAFAGWSDVTAAPDDVVAGINDAADKSADAIANLLK